MSRGNAILLTIVIAIALITVVAASVLHDGLSSRAKPTALESMLARNARHLAIPAGARKLQNPAAETPENLRDARLHFADHCAVCHANDGSGDTAIGRGLYPKPPDLRREETQNFSGLSKMECASPECPRLAARRDRNRIAGSWCGLFATCRSLLRKNAWRWSATTPKARKISKKNRKKMTSCVVRRCNRNRKGRIITECGC